MTVKEILLNVKAMFDAPMAPTPPVDTTAPADTTASGTAQVYKLQDGTEITVMIDDPAISTAPDAGDMVTIAGAPAPAGDLVLEDGSTLTVDASGMITATTALAPATQPEFVAPPAPTMEERLAALEAELSKMKQPASSIGMATEIQLQAAEAKITKQDGVINGLFSLVEKMSELPTAEPKTLVGAKKDAFDRVNKKEAGMQKIADAVAKMKQESKK